MVRIAVAGGTGGLGRTVVDELAQGNEHVVFVLSRKSELPFQPPSNVHCLAAPYDNVESLVELLGKHEIHTVISTMSPPTPEVHAAQDNLIRAASRSPTVERFIPSEWGMDMDQDDEHLPLAWKTFKNQSIAELQKHPNLEYTIVYNGYFMDYFGMPHCESYMHAETPFVDINAHIAAIPGSGNDPIVWTYTKDVAKFVRKMVESDEPWPTKSKIVGDKVSINEILQIAEQVRGKYPLEGNIRTKFEVKHDSLEDLRAGKISEIPAYQAVYNVLPKGFFLEMMAALAVSMIMGVFNFEGEVNEKYPDIKPVKMRDFLRTHWEGR